MLSDGLGEFLACTTACACESDIYTLEIIIMLKKLDVDFRTADCLFSAGTALASEKNQLINWEISFVKNSEEFLSDGAACAYDCYFHFLLLGLILLIN